MKNIVKNKILFGIVSVLIATTFNISCEFDEIIDPNAPSEESGILKDPSIEEIKQLAVGVESSSRNGLGVELTASGTVAREMYLFDADPRNTGDLLGADGASLGNDSFYSTTQWNGNYRCIKNANNLILGVTNTTSLITDEQKEGCFGFAKTMMAYEFIEILKSYNVARFDVADPDNLGPLLEFDEVLSNVLSLLDEAEEHLKNGGDDFLFTLSSGFDGFDTPEKFIQFNRAIFAIASVYAADGSEALVALSDSFFSLTAPLTLGPKHVFGLGSGDQDNPLFRLPSTPTAANNGDQIIVHNSWINDAEPGDLRVSQKAALRPDPRSQDGLNGTHETRLYAASTSSIDMIRNEELILVYAEAQILEDNYDEAVSALDIIRTAANLPAYSGDRTEAALINELLNQRRYSLWLENHRLFDLRRYDRINETVLPIDRAEDQLFEVFPIPLAEVNVE